MKQYLIPENVLQAVKQYILNSSAPGLPSGQVIDLWLALQGIEELPQQTEKEQEKK